MTILLGLSAGIALTAAFIVEPVHPIVHQQHGSAAERDGGTPVAIGLLPTLQLS